MILVFTFFPSASTSYEGVRSTTHFSSVQADVTGKPRGKSNTLIQCKGRKYSGKIDEKRLLR